MNIVLTGLRGSGKTKIGKLLSKKLIWDFVDLDREIEKSENMSIKDIVALRGWEYFRAKETDVTKKIAKHDQTVIATGGGTIIDPENEKALKEKGKIVYLYRKPEDCVKYIHTDPNRPRLTSQETLEEEMKHLYKERNGRYCESAHIIFHRTNNLEKDTNELIKKIFPE